MTFKEFDDVKSVKELNTLGETISKGFKLPEYYERYMENRDTVRMLETCFSFLYATKRSMIKYIEIDMGDGEMITILFESIFYANPAQIKIHDIPVSNKNNVESIRKVVRALCNKGFKISMITDDIGIEVLGLSGKVEPNHGYDNFYDTYDFVMRSKDTQKMKTKYRFKYLENHCNSYFNNVLSDDEKEMVIELRDRWEETCKHDKIYCRKDFINMCNFSSDDTFNMLTYYDSELVHYNKVLITGSGAIRMYSCNASRFKTENDERNKNVYNIERYTRIPLMKYLKTMGIDRAYHLGIGSDIRKDSEGLYNYKLRTHEGFVVYYKVGYESLKEV